MNVILTLYTGEFGVVYKGYLQQKGMLDTVAVKTLKGLT